MGKCGSKLIFNESKTEFKNISCSEKENVKLFTVYGRAISYKQVILPGAKDRTNGWHIDSGGHPKKKAPLEHHLQYKHTHKTTSIILSI